MHSGKCSQCLNPVGHLEGHLTLIFCTLEYALELPLLAGIGCRVTSGMVDRSERVPLGVKNSLLECLF